MSERTELDPIVADWLAKEATSAGSARVLAATLATIEATGQDRYVTQRLFGDQLGRSERLRWALLAAALAVALVGTIALAAGALLREPTHVPRPAVNGWIAFSANGEGGDDLSVTDVGRGTGRGDIYVARDGVTARRIIGTGDDGLHQDCPAFSPDGGRLAYRELDMSSVTPTPAPQPAGATDDEPALPPGAGEPAPPAWAIVVVEVAGGGTPTAEVTRVAAPALASCAEWSPDGRALAYVVTTSGEQGELRVSTLDGNTTRLGPATLYSQAFAWSPDGSTIAVLDGEQLWLVPADGRTPRTLSGPGANAVEWSPDGSLLAAGDGDIVSVLDIDGTRVADIDMAVDRPDMNDVPFAWSPDGACIAWADGAGIVRSTADGSWRERRSVDVAGLLDDRLADPLYPSTPTVLGWSPDGTQVLLAVGGVDSPGAIVAVPWDADQPAVVLVNPTFALRGIDATWQGVQEMKRTGSTILVIAALASGCAQAAETSPTPAGSAVASTPFAGSPGMSSLEYDWPAELAPGTYTTSLIWDTPFTVSFTVPAGWESRDVEVLTDPVSRVNELGGPRGRSVMFALVDNVYQDPCAVTLHEPPVGRSVDALAEALAGLPGVDATPPVPVTLGGHDGAYLELAVRPDAGCEVNRFHLWTSRREDMNPAAHSGGTDFTAERERYRIWILDVDGIRYLVAALSAADSTPADLAELQAVIDSVMFNTPG